MTLKVFRIDREITSSDGTQSFACEAENAEEAESIFKNGGGVLIDHEHTVEGLAPIECCEVYATDEDITPYDGSIKPPPKVKPLVWECSGSGYKASIGFSLIVIRYSFTKEAYLIVNSLMPDTEFATAEEAKKTAQEFFVKLILGSIE